MQLYMLWLAVALGLFEAYSLFKSNEGIRGLGRVAGGLAKVLVAAFMLSLLPAGYGLPCAILVLTGVVTLGSGARKFMRRNST